MTFDFDTFINGVCIGKSNSNGTVKAGLFGKIANYIPLNAEIIPFALTGDFHQDYQKAKPDTLDETVITSETIHLTVRKADFPKRYPKAQPGDLIGMDSLRFEIVDMREHIPGSQTLVLHEVI